MISNILKSLIQLSLVWGLVSVSVLSAQVGPTNSLDTKLNRRVESYDLAANSYIEALVKVLSDFQIPALIEWVDAPASKVPVLHNWNDATVGEILDQVVRAQPGYRLRIGNGVAHIETEEIAPGQNFLYQKIKNFDVNDAYIEAAYRTLHNMVVLTVSPPAPAQSVGGTGVSSAANTNEPKITLQLRNVTVDEIIEQFVTNSARKICIVTFADSFILTPTGFRRTETLWSPSMIPGEQPVWDMFHWGESVPTGKKGTRSQ
jgi:hypothetical protein